MVFTYRKFRNPLPQLFPFLSVSHSTHFHNHTKSTTFVQTKSPKHKMFPQIVSTNHITFPPLYKPHPRTPRKVFPTTHTFHYLYKPVPTTPYKFSQPLSNYLISENYRTSPLPANKTYFYHLSYCFYFHIMVIFIKKGGIYS